MWPWPLILLVGSRDLVPSHASTIPARDVDQCRSILKRKEKEGGVSQCEGEKFSASRYVSRPTVRNFVERTGGKKKREEEEKFYSGKFLKLPRQARDPWAYQSTHEREASHIFFQQCKEA